MFLYYNLIALWEKIQLKMKWFFKVPIVKNVEIKCKYHYIILDLVLNVYIYI